MLFDQTHDSGSFETETTNVRFELWVCVSIENGRGDCVGKENSNPTDDFNKSMPTTDLNMKTVELLISGLFSLCGIAFVKCLGAKKRSEDIG